MENSGHGAGKQYLEAALDRLEWVLRAQHEQIAAAGAAVAKAIAAGGWWFLFGTGHSHMLAEEAFYRAGGLKRVVPILDGSLMLHESAVQSTQIERLSGLAEILFQERGITERDVLLIASNSGRNAVTVEMAETAKAHGVFTIAVTSLAHSRKASSRAPSGRRLFEVADLVIDNGAPYGDAVIAVSERIGSMGPVSTITGAAIVNAIAVEAAGRLDAEGLPVDVWISANVDRTEEARADGGQPLTPEQIRLRCRHI
ncbi:MAG: SIS domain-containing protein [Firmicutes bacterium]|jgi:uncharacterized phosphosugar-binding protein|nr:SIS domain-containing protein [Bacillota bacterium]